MSILTHQQAKTISGLIMQQGGEVCIDAFTVPYYSIRVESLDIDNDWEYGGIRVTKYDKNDPDYEMEYYQGIHEFQDSYGVW